jgi:hypothetical protein
MTPKHFGICGFKPCANIGLALIILVFETHWKGGTELTQILLRPASK